MQTDIDLAKYFPPIGRHAYLESSAVKRLVLAVKPGYHAPATLEKYKNSWRLRVTIQGTSGESARRGITIPDLDTAEWVAGYLKQARLDRKQHRRATNETKKR